MRGQETRWEETGGNWKKMARPKAKPRKSSPPPRVSINESKNRIGISVSCDFAPERVDIFVRGNGAGKGFKVAIVENKTGEFKVNRPSKRSARPSGLCINAKALLSEDLNCKPGRYDVSEGVVDGKRALIFNAFPCKEG